MTTLQNLNLPSIHIQYAPQLTKLDQDLLRTLGDLESNLKAILDRGITFSDNFDARQVQFTSSGTPNAENTVAHTLGKVPIGYIVIGKDKAAHLYNGTTAWTGSNIYLKSDVATVVFDILIF